MLGEQAVERVFHFQKLAGVDFDIGRLSAQTAADQRLVDHHTAVGQGEAFAFGAGGQQHRAHAGGLAQAQGLHVGLDEVHGVVNRHAGGYAAAGAVDVEIDVFVGVFAFEKQKLRHHQIGGVVVDFADQKDNPFFEQARVDVEGALAAAALFDNGGNQGVVADVGNHVVSLLRVGREWEKRLFRLPLKREKHRGQMAAGFAAGFGRRCFGFQAACSGCFRRRP